MLIVCPSCATSYMIETASLGAGGRMVRCARCRATWFAGGAQEEEVNAFVDEVIAEAEAQSEGVLRPSEPPPPDQPPQAPADDFADGSAAENFSTFGDQPADQSAPEPAPMAAHRESFEPETIENAPPLVPPMEQAPADDHEAEPESEVETFAARRRRLRSRRKQAKRSSRWTAAILVLFALNVALIGGRAEVVRYLPQTASLFAAIGLPVNLQHLKFENVRISASGAGGEGLTVEGTIVSTADRPSKVPDLRFAARNAAGQEIYTWTAAPARKMLDPGAKLDFHTELATPPADAKDVLVRFLTKQEAAAMSAGTMKPSAAKPGAMAPSAMKPGAMTPAHGGTTH